MKIISPPEKTEDLNQTFENGHLYKDMPFGSNGIYPVYLYACGYLIDIATGKTMRNIEKVQADPKRYIDITDEYSLVHNSLIKPDYAEEKKLNYPIQAAAAEAINEELVKANEKIQAMIQDAYKDQ